LIKNITYIVFFSIIVCKPTLDSKKLDLNHNDTWIGGGVAYGPFRDGQYPGGPSPSKEELRQDLHIIHKYWNWIRVYGSRGVTKGMLEIIEEDSLDIHMMLGAWIGKVDSKENINNNLLELNTAIKLANTYPNIVNSINIGNETLVFWSDHKIPSDTLYHYMTYVQSQVKVPVTTADDFNMWNKDENMHIAEISDFIVMHAHPLWGGLQIDNAVDWVKKIYYEIQNSYPNKMIVIGETGWATQKHDVGMQAKLIKGKAGETEQKMFINEFTEWADAEGIAYFLFEVFDEKWKGGEHPNEVEKHWGLFYSDRSPKESMRMIDNK